VLVDLATGASRSLTPEKAGVFDAAEASGLWRVDPVGGDVEEVPGGTDVSQAVLEPGGRTAWVESSRCDDTGQCGGAWRLELETGTATRHPFDLTVGGDLAWTPDGSRLAASPTGAASRPARS
jgi:hypothetical protein